MVGVILVANLRSEHVRSEVILMGWVGAWRDLGGRRFIDLRDRYGLTQITFGEELDAELSARGKSPEASGSWLCVVWWKTASRTVVRLTHSSPRVPLRFESLSSMC